MRIHPAQFFSDRRYRVDPARSFVLMPFSEAWSERLYSTVKSVLQASGYTCKRGDEYYGRVVLHDIWEQINTAAFMVADLTGANPNVYYELGIAHTLGKEVIPLIQRGHQIPFDQQPFRVLHYTDDDAGYERLRVELPHWIENLSYDRAPAVLLKTEDVDAFNALDVEVRRTSDFVRDDFSGLALPRVDLSRTSLSESDLSDTDLEAADLSSAVLIRVVARGTRFVNARCHQANFSEARLMRADLTGADLTRALFLRAELDEAVLRDADVAGLTIDEATFRRYSARFEDARNAERLVIER